MFGVSFFDWNLDLGDALPFGKQTGGDYGTGTWSTFLVTWSATAYHHPLADLLALDFAEFRFVGTRLTVAEQSVMSDRVDMLFAIAFGVATVVLLWAVLDGPALIHIAGQN